jgi:hypothetical protein
MKLRKALRKLAKGEEQTAILCDGIMITREMLDLEARFTAPNPDPMQRLLAMEEGLETLYEYVRTNTSDNKPYSICEKMKRLFQDIFAAYGNKPFQAIATKE